MSSAALIGRMALSLGVVLVLVAGLARLARHRGSLGFGPARRAKVDVLVRQSVGKSSSLAVVRVGGRDLLVGVTPSTVSLLLDTEEGALVPAGEADAEPVGHHGMLPTTQGMFPSSPWKVMLEQLRERTVRRG